MYEDDQRSTELCVNYAPYFFYDFNRIITRMLVLHICRITDPAGGGSKANLTTNYIFQNLHWPADVQQRLAHGGFHRLVSKAYPCLYTTTHLFREHGPRRNMFVG